MKLECIYRAKCNMGSDVFKIADCPETLEELISIIFKDYLDEWGLFIISTDPELKKMDWPIEIDYNHGHFTSIKELPENFTKLYNKKILNAKAVGGWSRMDYIVYMGDLDENSNDC